MDRHESPLRTEISACADRHAVGNARAGSHRQDGAPLAPRRRRALTLRRARARTLRCTATAVIPLLVAVGSTASPAGAQTTPVEGLRQNDPGVHALSGTRIVLAPGNVLDEGTLVVRDGVIEAVGAGVRPPPDARVWDLSGHTVYPGFLDAYAEVGMPGENTNTSGRGAVYWNPQVRAHVDAAAELAADAGADERIAQLRAQGFTVAMAVPQLGMFRGRTAAVSLGQGEAARRVLAAGQAQVISLARDNRAGGAYPGSSMGSIALIRQVLYDADWYLRARAAYDRDPAGLRRPETNVTLAALGDAVRGQQALLFETRSEEDFLRVIRIAEEFSIRPWIRGSGYEYRLLDEVRAARLPLILPVAFPTAPNVDRPEDVLDASLAQLRHWYLAPENPGRLAAAGVEFALTAAGLSDRGRFLPNVRAAVERGLPPDVALAALTTVPARYLGLERTHGTLAPGKAANMVVVEGDLFDEGAEVRSVWVDGVRFEISSPPDVDPRGEWLVAIAGQPPVEGRLTLGGTFTRLNGRFTSGEQSVRLSAARIRDAARRLQFAFPGSALGFDGELRLTATVTDDEMFGWGETPDGTRVNWIATRVGPGAGGPGGGNPDTVLSEPTPAQTTGAALAATGAADASPGPGAAAASRARLELPDIRPPMEYGRPAIPERPAAVLVRNATIWTQGPQGVVEGADLLVRDGKVERVGRGLEAPNGALIIDAAGKHVTPGLIDGHLHAGVAGGVNEGGAAIVPEVRIGDVLTMNNIWMYRQLAGGLTTAHIMHGSANPIGGQNQIIKLRWGALPHEMRFEGAPRTVKFALGENPVRREGRYPDTRMGTEQIIRDNFQAAREYRAAWRAWEEGGRRGIPPRRDLRLEAIAEILEGEILVMSHSYRQDEILMLMRLAEEFGFRIRAFHHGVEAYKVAPDLARHGAGAFVWSDWSSFKIEAYDATTYNARVLLDAGVVASLHSDDSQVSSRMNWEAAKLLRTGIGEQEALALVTSNTAKLLGIFDRVGSLEPGKDADFVIWSGHPLSTASRAEQTWIDGRKYFDVEEDLVLRRAVERERAQIIQEMVAERRRGGTEP